jgi:hypothetical protein
VGFRFAERLSGTFVREGASHPMWVELSAFVDDWLAFASDRRARVDGIAHLEGVVDHAPVRGEMIVDPVLQKRVRYDLQFVALDGTRLRLHGQKDVSWLDLKHTMTDLPAVIDDGNGAPWGTAHLTFDLADLRRFLRSFRLL